MIVSAPVSFGELVDKIGILRIKQSKVTDPNKLANINKEHDLLNEIYVAALANVRQCRQQTLIDSIVALNEINREIWEIEDDIRDHERRHCFGHTFIELARNVYLTNDRRAAMKRAINDLVGSQIVEEKAYTEYKE